MSGNALELVGVTKEYSDGVVAVENLSLSLSEGELLVLVGPSGCGKSTTLRCIAGLEDPTDGEVRIGGEAVTARRPERRDVAMVFQNYALYPHKTAFENVAFGLQMTTNLDENTIRERVTDIADTLGITDLLDKKPQSLSGGQQQRVALGRAIVRDPSVFLLDEPLSNLDATLRARMRTEIQQLQRAHDVTTVYVTHDQTEAMTVGDRIAVLRGGQLQQVGTPMECYHRPATQFVAGFIGDPSMNFVECRYESARDAFTGPLEYPTTAGLASAVTDLDGASVTLGVRPGALTITGPDSRVGADTPTYRGQVDLVEPVGQQSFVHVTLQSGVSLTVAVSEDRYLREGDPVTVPIPPDGVHLFDGATGRAVRHPSTPVSGTDPGTDGDGSVDGDARHR